MTGKDVLNTLMISNSQGQGQGAGWQWRKSIHTSHLETLDNHPGGQLTWAETMMTPKYDLANDLEKVAFELTPVIPEWNVV